jgi:nitroimidazol reductase NimA-like FMN-containing flavoprotein (pyridoxamine 5'-phosphate oxidase superfamily)
MAELTTTGRRTLRALDREESLRLLAGFPLGRVIFTDRALPAVRPVNHLVDGGTIVIRTHRGAGILSAARRGVVVAYEADSIDLERHVGWSVVVTGLARPVRDPVAAERYRRALRPWVDQTMDEVIAISSDIVTGFELAIEPAG